MNKILTLKRPLVWLKRFRHRCGYGVHSPFAFELITSVIYEKSPYYSYADIESSVIYEQRKTVSNCVSPRKVGRLLFRLVNRYQPETIIEAGPLSVASLYLQAGCKHGNLKNITDSKSIAEYMDKEIGFLYIPYGQDIEFIRNMIDQSLSLVNSRSVFVVAGIGYDPWIKALWEEMRCDKKVSITFDLYDVGIAFFDNKKIKQHYVVNF